MIKDKMVPFLAKDEIDKLVSGLAKEIERDFEGQELIVICPLNGSFSFVADLVRKIRLPIQIDFVQLKSTATGGAIGIVKDICTNIRNKNVLIVEEIIDTGRKLSFLRDRLMASQPQSVRIAALLDKPARREIPLKPDYIGKTIEDRFVVGYGMDMEGIGRNYPVIYIFSS